MRAFHRILAAFAVLVVSVVSPEAHARTHQWANAFVSAPGCLSNQLQDGTGNLYNACGGYVLATLPAIIDSTGFHAMTVGGYVAGDSWCWINVIDQTSTNFYSGPQTHFQYQNQHTTQSVNTPAPIYPGWTQSIACELAPNSYLFTVNY